MKKATFSILILFAILSAFSFNSMIKPEIKQPARRWTVEEALKWQAENGWLRGSNFNPSTAINQLETWQAESFDTATINREFIIQTGFVIRVICFIKTLHL
jgi:hypothetical protein